VGAAHSRGLRYGAEIFHALKKVLKAAALPPPSATRAASRPTCRPTRAAIEVILEAIEKAGYKPGEDIYLALDVAASEFYEDGKYVLEGEGRTLDAADGRPATRTGASKYPIITIEDGLAEGDWDGWKR
jgi:enolase